MTTGSGSVRPRAKVVRIDLSERLTPIQPSAGYDHVLLVVRHRDAVLGEVRVTARQELLPEDQWAAIANQLGYAIRRRELESLVRERLLGDKEPSDASSDRPLVSVIVCTRDRPKQLAACLASLKELTPPADEILVVDNAPSDDRARNLCRELAVDYVLEPTPGQSRARNRGLIETSSELVAFTDDDCVVDPGWLDSLARSFNDPLVMAVTGYIGPMELDAPAQWYFELHGGFERYAERRVFEAVSASPAGVAAAVGAGANMVFRRAAFAQTGGFAEDLGPGTPARSGDDKYAFYRVLAAGFRIVYDPKRIVWHQHRSDWASLRRILNDYGVSEMAWSTRALTEDRDLSALRVWRWWLRHFAGDVKRKLGGHPTAVPLELTGQEVLGALQGPRAMRVSSASRRSIPALDPTAASQPRARHAGNRSPRVSEAEGPMLSVALASYDRRESLRQTLLALAGQDHPSDRHEVVLVLDGSTDGSAEMARSLELPYQLHVLEQHNRGLAATRNRGADEAGNPVVVFLDDDIRPVRGFLSAHAAAHSQAGSSPFVLGYYPPALADDSLTALALRTWWVDHFRRLEDPGHRWTFTDVCDGNSSVAVEAFRGLGGFDVDFTGGRRQDWELGIRLLASRIPLFFEPAARGDHHFAASIDTILRNARQEGRYDVLLARKHPGCAAMLPLARLAPEIWVPRAFGRGKWRLVGTPALAARARNLLELLEAARLRGRWGWLLERLWSLHYALGLADAIPDSRALGNFLDPARLCYEDLPIALDRGEPPGSGAADPPVPPGAPPRIRVEHRGRPVVAVPAIEPGGQWDLEAAVQRVAGELYEASSLSGLLERRDDTPEPPSA